MASQKEWDEAREAIKQVLLGSGIRPDQVEKYLPPIDQRPKAPSVGTAGVKGPLMPLPPGNYTMKNGVLTPKQAPPNKFVVQPKPGSNAGHNFAGRSMFVLDDDEVTKVQEKLVRSLNGIKTNKLIWSDNSVSYEAVWKRPGGTLAYGMGVSIEAAFRALRKQVPRTLRKVKRKIIGVRGWNLGLDNDGPKLRSLGMHTDGAIADRTWVGPLTTSDKPPARGTGHGLWAYKPEEMDRYQREYGRNADVTGFIEMYGRVVVAEWGWRAEKAIIRKLILSKPWPKIAAQLSDRYQCEVTLDKEADVGL